MIAKTTLINLLIIHGIPEKDIPMMMCIAQKESNFNPKAINKTGNRNGTKDHGLFQINDVNKEKCDVTAKQLLDVHKNIKCTVKVYKTQGLTAWATYNSCKKDLRRS